MTRVATALRLLAVGHHARRPGPDALPRMLAIGHRSDPGLGAHLDRHGALPGLGDEARRAEILREVDRADVRGRGGAGFPLARKLRAVRDQHRWSVVVANGTEGEPASHKDEVLLARSPHLVLDGAQVAAALVGARRVVVVAPVRALATVAAAEAERRALGGDAVAIEVVPAARGFVAGEASAVVRWVARGEAVPRATPPRLAERGLHGRPTLVQNVETLAQLALVARHGARWYGAVGTPREPGSMLVTLAGCVRRPGVHEVAIGTPLGDVAAAAGGAPATSAVLVGGYSGTWVPAEAIAGLALSRDSLGTAGATPGAGVLAFLPAARCGLAETARLVRYLAGESVGQCGPCASGLPAIAGELERLAGSAGGEAAMLERWLAQVDGRGACGHPDGVARMVRSALRVFAGEVDEHRAGWCRGQSDDPVLPVGPARPQPGARRHRTRLAVAAR